MSELRSETQDGVRVDWGESPPGQGGRGGYLPPSREVEIDEIMHVLSNCLRPELRWHKHSNTLDQMLCFNSGFDLDLEERVRAILECRTGLSTAEMNAKGYPWSINALFLDTLVAVARNWPMKPGDLNPLTGELIPMAKPTKTVSESGKKAPARAKEPSLEKMAVKKAVARSGKTCK